MSGGLRPPLAAAWVALVLTSLLSGCTTPMDYIRNGFKVGPNFRKPPAPVESDWIDAADKRVRQESDDLSQWWKVFNDPVLDRLICDAYRQNLSLREAGFRVLQARAQLGISFSGLFPQTQQMTGDYTRKQISKSTANNFLNFGIPGVKRYFGQWDLGFNLAWELDFWGRFRRAFEADSASLDASVEGYDDVLVTLLSDLATNYVLMRTAEKQIEYTEANVEVLTSTLKLTQARYSAKTVSDLDVQQARGTLVQTQAQVPELKIQLRKYENQLCILMGIAPEDLRVELGRGPIPTAPPEVALGIPAELLTRRPDIRRAERQAAAQCAMIGVAESDFYPHISITGTLGYSSEFFKGLFQTQALNGTIGPSFTWNILNFGRILSNVRLQDAKFQELVATYQKTVLNAQQEAENGLVTFLRAQERARFQAESVDAAEKSTKIVMAQYKAGIVDFVRVNQILQNQVDQQNLLAQVQGEIGQGLIQVYKALGGGWQLRLTGCETPPRAMIGPPTVDE